MDYVFPEIIDLEPLRRLVLEADGFTIIRKPDHIVFCYTYNSPEVFPEVTSWDDAVRRECRGIAFDLEGRLISRPFHKFFNLGERPETMPDVVDLSRPHVILEKLDGSMIRAIPIGDSYRLGTKTGVSLLTPQPEAFVAARPQYDAYIRTQLARGLTPVFEWCSRKQRIVLDYAEDRLVLTAVRENRTGRYVPLEDLRAEIADEPRFAGIEIVRSYPGTAESMAALVAETRGLEGQEGWIVRFDDGHMVKLKADWYVTRHRALEGLSREKVVVATLLAGAADDVKPLLAPEPRARFEAFETRFWSAVETQMDRLSSQYAAIREQYGDDRKSFALGLAQNLDPQIRALMFSTWAGRDLRTEFLGHLTKHASTSTKLDCVRWAFGGESWDYEFDGDA
ncbi:putative RNA ligase [Hyphomicrobium sp. 1Nfss2.1]|uniref:RNA ligase n=1 Tax=Hyphomicrobium sp. 1Nfss2.1 TaxID=3413936 RepID=UPI003C7DAF31